MKIRECPDCVDECQRVLNSGESFRRHVEHLSGILDETPQQVIVRYLSMHHALGHPSAEDITNMVVDAVTSVFDKLDKRRKADLN